MKKDNTKTLAFKATGGVLAGTLGNIFALGGVHATFAIIVDTACFGGLGFCVAGMVVTYARCNPESSLNKLFFDQSTFFNKDEPIPFASSYGFNSRHSPNPPDNHNETLSTLERDNNVVLDELTIR